MFAKHQGKSGFLAVFTRYFLMYRVVHTHTEPYTVCRYGDMQVHTMNSVCGHELLVVASGLQICSC